MAVDTAFAVKVFPILMSFFESKLSALFNGRVYSLVNPNNPAVYPYCIYQSQDGGGATEDHIDKSGWTGLITFRCIDQDSERAWNNAIALTEIVTADEFVFSVNSVPYTITAKADRPQWFPVEKLSSGNVYTAAIIIRFFIYN